MSITIRRAVKEDCPRLLELITEILKERRIELAYEGHRLFDLLRTGKDVIKSPANITMGTNTYNFLIAPILQADIDVNPNLVKNPGY